MATSVQVVIDCADPARLAAFWSAALGYQPDEPPEGYATWQAFLADRGVPEAEWNSANACHDPDGVGPRLFFQRVPEGKSVKNRLHLDLNVAGGRGTPADERRRRMDAEAERLVGLGATRLGYQEDWSGSCVNMADPEGNEFDLQ